MFISVIVLLEKKTTGANEASASSLSSFVKSLAHPQRSPALVLALSLIAVGIRTWDDESVSCVLVFLGLLILLAAIQWRLPSEVLDYGLTEKGMCQAPEPFIMDSEGDRLGSRVRSV